MRRYKYVSVTYAASSEGLAVALTSTDQVKRRILSVIPEQTASVRVRAYIEGDQIIDAPSNLFGAYTDPRFVVDRELAVGEQLSVGFFDEAGAGDTDWIIVEYEESGG